MRLELLVCDRSVSVNVITHTFVGLKCLTETKIQFLCDHVDHTCFHIIVIGCQMVQLLSAHIVGPTMFVNLTPALQNKIVDVLLCSQRSNMCFSVHKRTQMKSHKNAFCTLVYTTEYSENSCVH